MKKTFLFNLMHLWPPYFGAGIRVKRFVPDLSMIEVEMKLRFWNRNFVGTQFGGSLYSMTDPFLMLMLIERLGKDYIVWDKDATIRFKKPGKGHVRARFHLTQEQIDSFRAEADQNWKIEPKFQIEIMDDTGTVVAEVEKTLYIRRKDREKTSVPVK